MPVACVIGNPAIASDSALEQVSEDARIVIEFLDSKNVHITNRDASLSLTSDQMRHVFKTFVDVCSRSDGPYYFYFSGHAFEKDDDIYLVGEEVTDLGSVSVLQSFRLKDCLVSLEQLSGLKIVLLDACRSNPGGEEDDEGFERQAETLLQNIPDLVLITSTSAGRPSYDGQFTRRLIARLKALDEDDLVLPLQNWLDALMSELSAELNQVQRPALSHFVLTQDWTLGDVVAGEATTDPLASLKTAPGNDPIREQRNAMSLQQLDRNLISAYLTDVREKSGGNISGYFMFSNGELEAADYGAYRDDTATRLGPGYSLVESAAIRGACTALEPAGRVVSRDQGGQFGDLLAIIFGFSRTIVTMTVPAPSIHLIGVYHPKRRYHYGMAINSQQDLLELVRIGKATTYTSERKKALREAGEFDLSHKIENPDPIATEKLLRPSPEALSALMNRATADEGDVAFSVGTARFRRGFVLLAQDDTREKRKTIRSMSNSLGELQSQSKKETLYRYGEDSKPLASKDFTTGILDVLSNEQSMLKKAADVERITGPLRTFWLSFEKAVIGVNPFDDVREGKKFGQYFLLSVYVGKTQADLRFNYGDARQLIRVLCDEAGAAV